MKHKYIALSVLFAMTLTACQEPYYRGVPASQWQQLTPAQKSLIIDQAYDQDMNRAQSPAGTVTMNTPIGAFNMPRDDSPVMLPLQATKMMTTHRNEAATLVWQMGTTDAGVNANSPIYGMTSRSYNKAQQAVFMTSLQDTLERQQAFHDVTLVPTAPKTITQPTITIYFKSARVGDGIDNNKITLDTVLRIESPHQAPFTRTYLLTSDANQAMMQQETDVSTRLLDKILQGIDDWSHITKN